MKGIRLRFAKFIAGRECVVVPREPTKPMVRAAAKAMSPSKRPTQNWVSVNEKHRIRYKAMIEAK